MPAQVITPFDIDTVEKKILSKSYFNAEECRDQLDDLFSRFLEANFNLQGYLDSIFKLKKGLAIMEGEQWKAHRQKAQELQNKGEKLAERLEDPGQRIAALQEWYGFTTEQEELDQQLEAEGKQLTALNKQVNQHLATIRKELENERVTFDQRMEKLKTSVRRNKRGIFFISLLVSVIVALSLEYSGLASFSNELLTILQVVMVFLITEWGINAALKWNERKTQQPALTSSLSFVREKLIEYDQEIDRVCADNGIKREDVFAELDALYDRLKIHRQNRAAPSI